MRDLRAAGCPPDTERHFGRKQRVLGLCPEEGGKFIETGTEAGVAFGVTGKPRSGMGVERATYGSLRATAFALRAAFAKSRSKLMNASQFAAFARWRASATS